MLPMSNHTFYSYSVYEVENSNLHCVADVDNKSVSDITCVLFVQCL